MRPWSDELAGKTIAIQVAEIDRLQAELAQRENATWVALERDELNAISRIMGSSFMDPPDGGDVTLVEQVQRMRAALSAAEAELATERERVRVLREALSSIDVYGSDTLSGPSGGVDDRKWHRDAVLEMTRRAAAATEPKPSPTGDN